MTEIAERIGALKDADVEDVMDTLKGVIDRYSFKRMGFSGEDGTAYTTDGLSFDISDRDYFSIAMQGENYISDLLIDPLDDDEIIIFSMPVRQNSRLLGGAIPTYRVESLRNRSAASYDCNVLWEI